MEKVTYGALKKPVIRKEMLKSPVVKLGTQSGNYGLFTEDAKILTPLGAEDLMSEIKNIVIDENWCVDNILKCSPTLKKLLRG